MGTDCGIGLVRDGRFDQMELSGFDREMVIKSILPAKNRNYLWLGTNKGFSYFNTNTQEFEFTVNTKDGLSGDEITPGGLFIDQNDLLWVGTYHGISNFNIRAKSNLTYSPVCYIEKMFLNGERIEAKADRYFLTMKTILYLRSAPSPFPMRLRLNMNTICGRLGTSTLPITVEVNTKHTIATFLPGNMSLFIRQKGKITYGDTLKNYEFTIRKAWYNTWIFRITLILVFIVITYLFYIIRISAIKAQRNKLEQQVRERTHELEVANTEIEAQRDFARFQRDQIAQQQKSIMDSINYAQTIQNSLLPSADMLKEHLPEHFILFKPRDIVSGDYYWVSDQMDHLYVAAADCTGHGVPGAFMSMLGMALMNEIVNKHPQIDPDELLNELRSQIMETLHQKGDPGCRQGWNGYGGM